MASSISEQKTLEKKIKSFAIFSRFSIMLLQVVFNVIIPDHDAMVFNPPSTQDEHSNSVDRLVWIVLGGLKRWDGIYFLHIAEHGYSYENCLAFFPLFPWFVWAVSNSVLYPLQFLLNYATVILLGAVLINYYLFIKSAILLFRLGMKVTENDTISYKAALLFCINPASIFMSAPYSETLYLYLSLEGMLSVEITQNVFGSILFGLGSATRSNGLLNTGYILCQYLKTMPSQLYETFKGMMFSFTTLLLSFCVIISKYIIPKLIILGLSTMPFWLYQFYSYHLFCTARDFTQISKSVQDYGRKMGYKLVGDGLSSWCNESVPLAYSYIQKYHWNLGLFRYYEVKQIPNFVLALPVTVLCLSMVISFYRYNDDVLQTFGLKLKYSIKNRMNEKDKEIYKFQGYKLFPYIIHTLTLMIFGWLFIHTQVLTRLLFSSCPVLYWYCAHLITQRAMSQPKVNKYNIVSQLGQRALYTTENSTVPTSPVRNMLTIQILQFKNQNLVTQLVLLYFLAYFTLGTTMFSNFLPWT
ncbi:hypothetical protein CHS0354_040849 [Potamilus streckersoni]|uniref:GPI mannosyltransferase 2 n=1 Tax=Potamilus streckersoni TaxID=2493646 RepID=A0AAE0SLC0_9BIVA|nr:hypothetical protein CHS0354_040849 [Potamilus streckersoni]